LRRRSKTSKCAKARGRKANTPKHGNSRTISRLRRELNEANQQRAATTDLLKVISRAPFSLSTVLDTLVESAAHLCDAEHAWLFRRDGECYRWAASYGRSQKQHERLKEYVLTLVFLPGRGSALERAVLEGRPVQIADVAADPDYTRHGIRRIGDYRTALSVPLLREGVAIGALVLTRSQPRTFTDKHMELLITFADQAVTAIEYTRLLNELRQSLEQQTATSEVLRVVSSSPSDLAAVFQAMLSNATQLCQANFGTLNLYRDGEFPLAATHNVPEIFLEFRRINPIIKPGPGHPLARVAASRQPLQIADMRTEALYLEKDPSFIAMVDLAGARTLLIVPMLKENDLLGVITIFRQDVRPFTEKQIELVGNFAAHAVIAIENARLLSEFRHSLELQTATADVLRIISSSPSDLRPVFDAIAENAARLCHGFDVYVQLREGNLVRYVAHYGGIIPSSPAVGGTRLLTRDLVIGRAMFESRAIHLLDAQAESEEFPEGSAIARRTGYRTIIAVPLMRQGYAIGTIAVRRVEAKLFSDKEVELLSNFAAEAVIAIENARLLTELRQRTADLSESLEQQTATFEVLKVISSSPGELEPVFRAILENATRICEAKIGILFRFDDGAYTAVATLGVTAKYQEYLNRGPVRAGPGTGLGRVAAGEKTVHIIDTHAEQAYADREPLRVATAELGGVRSLLNVPMLKDGELIGAIGIYRQEVRPFTDKQVELVTNFAAQAVIAIENARLLNELAKRTEQLEMRSQEIAKLNEQLEQRVANQVGEIERMGRLRRFLPPQVADLIVASGTEKQLESHRREITALFCDLRGFTGFSESSDPEDVMALLRDYHEAIGQIIIKYGGTLERFAGDGVMVIFNDPVRVENPALQAVLMALDMRMAIGALIQKWRDLGHDLGFGIGIAHGFATLGTIGFEGRRDYAAIGTVSNVASRLCDEAKPGQILISPRVRQAVEKAVMVEPVGEFTLKGIRRPLPAYNVLECSPSKPN
jgi:GAF domain-containing protein